MLIKNAAIALVLAGCLAGCADAERDRLTSTTRPTYDKKTGRLVEITHDANRDGRVDTWTDMSGTEPLRSRIDRDEDGRIDRWEYYQAGQLAKLGFSQSGDEKPDAWAFAGADGRVQRVEVSSTGDESRIDRWEYYDPTPGERGGPGALVRAEVDTDRDGRPDRWETYANGAIHTAAFDENRDGVPDRRLTYRGSEIVSVETSGVHRAAQPARP
jgi:hypothetical protein